MARLALILSLSLITAPVVADSPREWTRSDGKTAIGELVAKGLDSITIRLAGGTEATIPITSLSLDDQQYVKDWKPKRPITVPEDAVYFNGSWYAVVLDRVPWDKARQKSKAMGGHLAWIKDQPTHDFLLTQTDELRLWIGASDEETEGLWKWTDGSKLEFKKWMKGQPSNLQTNEDWLLFTPNGWNDAHFGLSQIVGYIVQWDR